MSPAVMKTLRGEALTNSEAVALSAGDRLTCLALFVARVRKEHAAEGLTAPATEGEGAEAPGDGGCGPRDQLATDVQADRTYLDKAIARAEETQEEALRAHIERLIAEAERGE
jgi:hypothetical protein